jgi:NAD(P)H-hydrate epimerase
VTRKISSAAQVRALDAAIIEGLGVPGAALMEIAARGVAEVVRERLGSRGRVGIAVGPGNNGGDGWAAARWLAGWGIAVEVVSVGAQPKSGDAAIMREAAIRAGIHGATWSGTLPPADLWVDALFGTGLARPLDGDFAAVIEAMGASGAPIVAVDLPSGLHADTGAILGTAPRAAATVSFGRCKPAMFNGEGPDRCGDVTLVDIGLDAAPGAADQVVGELGDATSPPVAPPRRPLGGHKQSNGHLLVLAGSVEMAGAAVLACRGALASGVGLVTLSIPPAALPRLGALPPEVMVASRDSMPDPSRFTAVAAGPGLGGGRPLDAALTQWLTSTWRDARAPAVFDADAPACCTASKRPDRVLTPHPGEAARRLDVPRIDDRFAAARRLSEYGVALLKGRFTLVCQQDVPIWVNPTGGPALSTGGTGDVLCGLIGGLLARGLSGWDAARLAAWAHGSAGDALSASGRDEPTSSELPAEIAAILARARH